jgi:hypothetical protein
VWWTEVGSDDAPAPERPRVDKATIKALARLPVAQAAGERSVRDHRGGCGAEKINPSYVSRVLRMTLLAPDIVELVLNGIHDPKLILATLMQRFPVSGLASDYSGHCPNSQSEGACSRCHYAPGSIATSPRTVLIATLRAAFFEPTDPPR